jgi:hypothetical protein
MLRLIEGNNSYGGQSMLWVGRQTTRVRVNLVSCSFRDFGSGSYRWMLKRDTFDSSSVLEMTTSAGRGEGAQWPDPCQVDYTMRG